MKLAASSRTAAHAAAAALFVVACHDVTPPEPAPPPGDATFYAVIDENFSGIEIAYSATAAAGVKRVHVDSPEYGWATLFDTTFADAPRSVNRVERLAIPAALQEAAFRNDLPLRLVVEDSRGIRGHDQYTVANEWVFHAYGRVDGVDHNPFVLVGDTLRVSAGANGLVPFSWVGIQLNGQISRRDSVPASNTLDGDVWVGSSGAERWKIVVDQQWVPRDQYSGVAIEFMARDIFGRPGDWGVSYMPYVVDARRVASGPRVRIADSAIRTVLVDEKRDVAYVAWKSRAEVGVLDLATMRFRAPIALKGVPGWPAFSVTGDSLIVPDRSRPIVEIVDLVRGTRGEITIADTGNYETPRTPWTVAATSNGHLLVTVGLTPDSFAWLVDVNLATGEQRRRADVGESATGLLGGSCAMIASYAGGRRAVVTWQERTGRRASAVYDAATGSFSDSRSFEALCGNGVVQPIGDGERLLIGNQLVDQRSGAMTLVKTLYAADDRWPDWPSALSPDGQTAVIATDYGFAIARTADGGVVDKVLEPTPEVGLGVAPHQLRVVDGGKAVLVFTEWEAVKVPVR